MTSAPAITCVVPTFNRPDLLRRALNSVLSQSYRNVRVCVYDNASGESTEQLVRAISSVDDRVVYHRHRENLGAQANLAFGVDRVDTPLFSVLCDDDALLPGFYASAVESLGDPAPLFYCGRTVIDNRLLDSFGYPSLTWKRGVYQPSEDTVIHMIRDHFIVTGVVFKSRIRELVGSFAEHASDKSYMITAAAMAPFVVDQTSRAIFTIHARSFSGGVSTTDDRAPQDTHYIVELYRDAVRGLARTPFPALPESRVGDVLAKSIRRELLYTALFQSVPLGRWRVLDTLLNASGELRMPLVIRSVLLSLRAGSRVPVLREFLQWSVLHFTQALSLWRARRSRDPRLENDVAVFLAKSSTELPVADADAPGATGLT